MRSTTSASRWRVPFIVSLSLPAKRPTWRSVATERPGLRGSGSSDCNAPVSQFVSYHCVFSSEWYGRSAKGKG